LAHAQHLDKLGLRLADLLPGSSSLDTLQGDLVKLGRDKYFFHYTTGDAAFGSILPKERLRFSRYAEMRDPLENRGWWIAGASSDEGVRSGDLDVLMFNSLASTVRQRALLVSLCMDAPDDARGLRDVYWRGWTRARMWEQYAENHEGVCLVFDREILGDAIDQWTSRLGFRAAWHGPVDYSGDGVILPIAPPVRDEERVTPAEVEQYIEQNYKALFFTKTLDWETEHEYRFVTIAQGDKGGPTSFSFGAALKAVIVGERFPFWQQRGAILACEDAKALPLRVEWETGRPRLRRLEVGSGRSAGYFILSPQRKGSHRESS
jgi:Protein of unknown function (DUF2971)